MLILKPTKTVPCSKQALETSAHHQHWHLTAEAWTVLSYQTPQQGILKANLMRHRKNGYICCSFLSDCVQQHRPARVKTAFRSGALFPVNPPSAPCSLHNIRFQRPSIQQWSITSSQPPATRRSRTQPKSPSERAGEIRWKKIKKIKNKIKKKQKHPKTSVWSFLPLMSVSCSLLPQPSACSAQQHPSISASLAPPAPEKHAKNTVRLLRWTKRLRADQHPPAQLPSRITDLQHARALEIKMNQKQKAHAVTENQSPLK